VTLVAVFQLVSRRGAFSQCLTRATSVVRLEAGSRLHTPMSDVVDVESEALRTSGKVV